MKEGFIGAESGYLKKIIGLLLPDAQKFLSDLVAIPSLSTQEEMAVEYCARAFSGLADKVEKIPLGNWVRDDKDYCNVIPEVDYEGRHNLLLGLEGCGQGRSLILNTHLDVVPPSDGQKNPYDAVAIDDTIYGRGTCDAKGQVATIFLLLSAIKKLDIRPAGNVTVHLVVEEENGGNGTLAMMRKDLSADGAIVLEDSDLKILTASRGALWFRITCRGKAGHSGSSTSVRSALEVAVKVMDILRGYHAELVSESRDVPLFAHLKNPAPLTFGRLSAGNWPAAVPCRAVLEGVIGFLPNKNRTQVMKDFRGALAAKGGSVITDNCDVEFTFAHDAHVIDAHHPLTEALFSGCKRAHLKTETSVLTASSDAWLYNNRLKIPTLIFGAGSIKHAHSKEEQIKMRDIALAAEALLFFIQDWCGTNS